MELLTILLALIASILVTIFGHMFAIELYNRSSLLADWVITFATARLPNQQRQRYQEEWKAHIAECEGNLSKVCSAIGFVIASRKMAQIDALRSARTKSVILADFRTILNKLKAGERKNTVDDRVLVELELEGHELELVEQVAARFNCSVEIATAALISLGLKHKEYFFGNRRSPH
jgi:hypothetical protein